jgi:NAD+ kinase
MESAFKTIVIIGKYMNPEIREQIVALADFLTARQIGVLVEENTAAQSDIQGYEAAEMADICGKAELAVVVGGDGTMLSAARAMVDCNIPLVGVNRGRFGFLTDLSTDSMLASLDRILAGKYSIEQRMLLSANISRYGEVIDSGHALNDVVISKSGGIRLIELEVYIDGQFVYRQRSDGLIAATPTGTTAYALSAGGPILHPTLDAIAIVPICPHTLSNRPIAINSASNVEITLIHAEDARVHFDGQVQVPLQQGDTVLVRRAENTISLLHPAGHSHYGMLRDKLRWG